jgi:hypothetical protein
LGAGFNPGGLVSRCFEQSRRRSRPRLSGGAFFGLILIVLGLVFLLDNLRVIYAEDALNLWPCALIALGLLRLWSRGFLSVWGQLLVAGGVLCLAGVFWNEAAIEVWWPVLVVWAGLFVALKAFVPRGRGPWRREHCREWSGARRYDGTEAAPATISREGKEHGP